LLSDMWARTAQGYVNYARQMWSAGVVPRRSWTRAMERKEGHETATRAFSTLPARAGVRV
jgi:hypothetical protein